MKMFKNKKGICKRVSPLTLFSINMKCVENVFNLEKRYKIHEEIIKHSPKASYIN